jgi:hypothetical protein
VERHLARVAVVVLLLALVAGCSDGSEHDAAVALVAADLVAYPRAELRSDEESACVARGIVERLGIDRLEALGLDLGARQAPRLYGDDLTQDEGDEVYAAYDQCLDLGQRDVEGFMADGLTERQARCVADGYRATGIPRAHLTEPPHSGEPSSVQGHADLEAFLEATKQACRSWL